VSSAGLKAERAQFPEVSRALEKVATERGLQLHENWLNKCIQLYETYLVSCGCHAFVISNRT
jgi:dynein heavy chain